jgi:hypothetical protein
MILMGGILIYGPGFVLFRTFIMKAHAVTETKWATSHITGTFTNPNNAIGATDGVWAGQLNTSTSQTSRWAMDNPSGPITGTQTINVWAEKGSNSGTPTIALNLYENGTLVQSIAAATNVTSTTGMNITGTFNASAIGNPNNVEIEVVETAAGGSPSVRNSAQIDSIQWTVNLADYITAGSSGTHVSSLNIPSTSQFVGGAFNFIRNTSSANITSIKLHNNGTVNAQTNLSNVKLFYKQEVACSTSLPSGTTQFNSTAGTFNASSDTTVTGTLAVGTSQICVYVTLDIGSGASNGDTLQLQITNPSTDIVASAGTVSPATTVAISGTTTLTAPTGPTTDQAMRGGEYFSGGTKQPYYWAQ